MSFVVEDSGKAYLACFDESADNQFTFFVTNFKEFLIEKLNEEVLMLRVEEMNESLRFKSSKILKVLKTSPESFTLNDRRVDLTFVVNTRQLHVYFQLELCESSEDIGKLAAGFLKVAIEQSILINRMNKALESKDKEIEEYKMNGGTLIRDSAATAPFNYQAEQQQSELKLQDFNFVINPAQAIQDKNIPALCAMINAEQLSEEVPTKLNSENRLRDKKNNKGKSRNPLIPKVMEKKFEYVNEEEESPKTSLKKESSKVAEAPKKAKIAKKAFDL